MRFVIVTGMSGAGKSTVLKALEDTENAGGFGILLRGQSPDSFNQQVRGINLRAEP